MMEKRKQTRAILILTIVIVAVAAVMLCVYFLCRPVAVTGEKSITLKVVTDDTASEHQLATDAAYLGEALQEEGLVAGEESQFGLFVQTVDGITASTEQMQWWCLTKGGEAVYTGVDSTPIEDGDTFEFTLTTGY